VTAVWRSPAARAYELKTHFEHVVWGPVRAGTTNEWVTADALAVLAAADRLS
jgi:hypothetical protein